MLKMFTCEVRPSKFVDCHDDPADLNRKLQPKPELIYHNLGIDPVVVFYASNFSFAFLLAGGDIAARFGSRLSGYC